MARGRHPHAYAIAGAQAVVNALKNGATFGTGRQYWLKRCEPYPAYTNRGLQSFWLEGSRPLASGNEIVHGPYGSAQAACDAASELYGTSASEQVADHLFA